MPWVICRKSHFDHLKLVELNEFNLNNCLMPKGAPLSIFEEVRFLKSLRNRALRTKAFRRRVDAAEIGSSLSRIVHPCFCMFLCDIPICPVSVVRS